MPDIQQQQIKSSQPPDDKGGGADNNASGGRNVNQDQPSSINSSTSGKKSASSASLVAANSSSSTNSPSPQTRIGLRRTSDTNTVIQQNEGNETIYEFGSNDGSEPSSTTATIGTLNNSLQDSSTPGKLGRISLASQSTPNVQSVRSNVTPGNNTSSSTVGLSSSSQNPNFDSHVISERVKNLATQIYQELKRIISRCNYDEDVLGGLMPLIVRVLESLDLALIENQQLQVELELCKDDNEQLAVMFEKEKAAKRAIDKKLIESEYAYEEERQQCQQKIESLENIVKMFELKAKNASDQAARLEEKESERNIEYNKLHDRYSDLLKSHCDVMERVRHLIGNDSADVAHLTNSSGGLTISVDHQQHANEIGQRSRHRDASGITSSTPSRRSEMNSFGGSSVRSNSKPLVWNDTTELTLEDASLTVIDDDDDGTSSLNAGAAEKNNQREESERSIEPDDFGDKDSITYTSMEREFRKLIQENRDLLNTKNALNVVKDDLIAEVDRLSNVVSMYDQEIKQLSSSRDQLRQKTQNLESGLRAAKEELAKAQQKLKESDEEGVPYSQRKRFSRVEMAKVLMERNGYKEKLFELQDAIRYTESVRANRVETEKRSGLWKFFSNLFGAPSGAALTMGPGGSRNASPVLAAYGGAALVTGAYAGTPDGSVPMAADAMQNLRINTASKGLGPGQRLSPNSDLILFMDTDLASDRKRAAIAQRDLGDRIQAYGWSLPDSAASEGSGSQSTSLLCVDSAMVARLKVPIPLYCRPLSGDLLGMKIWCATSIDFGGGETGTVSSKAAVTGEPKRPSLSGVVLPDNKSTALKNLEAEVARGTLDNPSSSTVGTDDTSIKTHHSTNATRVYDDSADNLRSSYVWICSVQHSRSKITIIDIKNKPNNVLHSFIVPTYLYCICSIVGSKSSDLGAGAWTEALNYATTTAEAPGKDNVEDAYKVVEIDEETAERWRQRQARKRSSLASSDSPAHQARFAGQQAPASQAGDSANTPTTPTGGEDEISRVLSSASTGAQTLQRLDEFVAHTEPANDQQADRGHAEELAAEKQQRAETTNESKEELSKSEPISTSLPTVWMGGKDRTLYVHSAVGQWGECIACVQLTDSILQICHHRGRAFVALANGQLCVFSRTDGPWDLSRYITVDIGRIYARTVMLSTGTTPSTSSSGSQSASNSAAAAARPSGIRCLEMANQQLWLGYKNYVFIVDPIALKVLHSFQVVPQADNQVRQMVAMKDGVFCCLRSDLTLRLYSALDPYQHIQDIDIEPIITRLISPKTFVISRITALRAVDNRLWVGDAHGIILTIPCDWNSEASERRQLSDNLTIARYIPHCDVANAQLSFHGHKDAVKFFVHTHNLMLSGGEGYFDFRVAIDEHADSRSNNALASNKSHLILWQISDQQ